MKTNLTRSAPFAADRMWARRSRRREGRPIRSAASLLGAAVGMIVLCLPGAASAERWRTCPRLFSWTPSGSGAPMRSLLQSSLFSLRSPPPSCLVASLPCCLLSFDLRDSLFDLQLRGPVCLVALPFIRSSLFAIHTCHNVALEEKVLAETNPFASDAYKT